MAFLSSMNIAASGLTAQKLRLDVASENLANINTTRTAGTEEGEDAVPYTRKMVVFQPIAQSDFHDVYNKTKGGSSGAQGVIVSEIVEDDAPYQVKYDPTHPDANAEGYVLLPNVDTLKETTDAMAASRAYEANITAFNAIKTMAMKGLEIGK